MVYEAHRHPAVHRVLDRAPASPRTWSSSPGPPRRIGAFIVPKVGFAPAHPRPPGHAADLAPARPRRSLRRLRPLRERAAVRSARRALVGALIDEKVDTKEVIATIVDLARRGLPGDHRDQQGRPARSARPMTIFTPPQALDDLTGFEQKRGGRRSSTRPPRPGDHQRAEEPLLHARAAHLQGRSTTRSPGAGSSSATRRPCGAGGWATASCAASSWGCSRSIFAVGRRRRLGVLPVRLDRLGDHRLVFARSMPHRTRQGSPGAAEVGGVPQLPARPHPLPGHGRRPRRTSRSTCPTPSPSAWSGDGCGASKT